MANSEELKQYSCSGVEEFSGTHPPRNPKNPDMVLNLDTKSDTFLSDQTPTPIKIIQKFEEIGLFQDLQSINPFEETFRKAAEDIRSGTTPLKVSSLSVPNNNDDSLHTPLVVFPHVNDLVKRKGAISPRADLPSLLNENEQDQLCLTINDDSVIKPVLQEEANTSKDTQVSNVNDSEDEASAGTIQFLLRMPNGKMVQLSSLPVEQMESVSSGPKENDIPIIKVDSTFLQSIGEDSTEDSNVPILHGSNHSDQTFTSGPSTSNDMSAADSIWYVETASSSKSESSQVKPPEGTGVSKQTPKMSLAKQKLKLALMNNTCPATTSFLSGVISNGGSNFSDVQSNQCSSQHVELRRLSNQSDESMKYDDSGRDLSSVEEKRRRNRAAAMRCREKRKTWVKELERRANEMLRTNSQLQCEVSMLRDEVAQLKTLLLAHRDCPVTQALVQGKATLPSGSSVPTPLRKIPTLVSKRLGSKGQKSPSTVVLPPQPILNSVKPMIVLGDPPVKRKRLNSSTSGGSSVPIMASSSPPTSVHTLVLPSITSNNSTIVNSSFANVVPRILVANPAVPSSTSVAVPSQVIYSQILPIPALAPNTVTGSLSSISSKPGIGKSSVGNVTVSKQAYILPKSNINPILTESNLTLSSLKTDSKLQASHYVSTNVIKVNPNAVERDLSDSDIEILDVK